MKSLISYKFLEKIEGLVVLFSVFLMFVHAFVIFLSKNNFLNIPFFAEQNFLQVISTPFTLILIFELFLVIISTAESLSVSIGKQYQIVTLLLIRDVFKLLASFDVQGNFYEKQIGFDFYLNLFLDILFAILAFVLIYFYFRIQNKCFVLLQKQENEKSFVNLKLIGMFSLFILFFYAFFRYLYEILISVDIETAFINFKNLNFISDVFVGMIIIDVALLLLAFRKTHKFNDIVYEAILVLSAIIVRFSFVLVSPISAIISFFGISVGVIISFVYSKISKS